MVHSGSKFWSAVVLSLLAFGLCLVAVICTALLVRSIAYGTPDLPVEAVIENTRPVGKVFYRGS